MIIDHKHAMMFQFDFNLLMCNNITHVDKLEINTEDYFEKFLLAEQTKTLFLINYAYIDK